MILVNNTCWNIITRARPCAHKNLGYCASRHFVRQSRMRRSKPGLLEVAVEGEDKKYELTLAQVGRFPGGLLSSLVDLPRLQQSTCVKVNESGAAAPANVMIPEDYAKELPFVIELYKTGSLLVACKQLPGITQTSASFSELQSAMDYFQLPTNELLDLAAMKKAVEVESSGQPSWPMADAGADQQLSRQEGFEQSLVGAEVSAQFLGLQSFLHVLEIVKEIKKLIPKYHDVIASCGFAEFAFGNSVANEHGVRMLRPYIRTAEQAPVGCIPAFLCVEGSRLVADSTTGHPCDNNVKPQLERIAEVLGQELQCTCLVDSTLARGSHGGYKSTPTIVLRWRF